MVILEQTKKPEDTCQPTNIVHYNVCDMSKYNDCIHVEGMYYDIYIYTVQVHVHHISRVYVTVWCICHHIRRAYVTVRAARLLLFYYKYDVDV